MKPFGSAPLYGKPGSLHCQLGVTRQKVSQRCSRHACPIRCFSSTTCSMPRCFKQWLIDRPACPPPTMTAGQRRVAVLTVVLMAA